MLANNLALKLIYDVGGIQNFNECVKILLNHLVLINECLFLSGHTLKHTYYLFESLDLVMFKGSHILKLLLQLLQDV